MSEGPAAEVRLRSRTIRRIRIARELPRYALGTLAAAGIAASMRMLIAPPRPASALSPSTKPEANDRAAEAYAALFARRYLTWTAADPNAGAGTLDAFGGSALEASAGLVLPASGSQRVSWAEVVQQREPEPGERVYTVAAETEPEGLLYLTVAVASNAEGSLELAGYPAFVGAPAAVPARPAARAAVVEDGALSEVVRRALGNYLAGAAAELAADLVPGASIGTPTLALRLLALDRLSWAAGGAVTALVQAGDRRGTRYTLSYELDVRHAQGRWEIAAIQTVSGGEA